MVTKNYKTNGTERKKMAKIISKDVPQKALKIYLENGGTISNIKLGKKLGVSRYTISKWKLRDKWADELNKIQQTTKNMLAEKIADKVSDELIPEFAEMRDTLKIIHRVARESLFQHTADGKLILDARGNAIPKPDMDPGKLNSLTNSMLTAIKALHLILGRPTEINKNDNTNRIDGKITHTVDTSNEFDRMIEKIMETGDMELQKELDIMMESYQRIHERM